MMDDEQEEVKKRMQSFLDADNAMRRPNAGSMGGFFKLFLITVLFSLGSYGVYMWHPWKFVSETRDGKISGCLEQGYETTRAIELFGIRFNEKTSVICDDKILVD